MMIRYNALGLICIIMQGGGGKMKTSQKIRELVKRHGSIYAVSKKYGIAYTTLYKALYKSTEDNLRISTFIAIDNAWQDTKGAEKNG